MASPRQPRTNADTGAAAVVFDMDGVLTDTAGIHAAAWKSLFDPALAELAPNAELFDVDVDYARLLDGLAREDGVRVFFEDRGVEIPADGEFSLAALTARKQHFFNEELAAGEVVVFDDTVELIKRLRAAGVPVALATSSRNSTKLLEQAGLTELFDVLVDGNTSIEKDFPGKPAPDLFLEAARQLGVSSHHCAVFEDARAGVEAAHAGGFGLIIGVNRGDQATGRGLWEAGADRVLADISSLDTRIGWMPKTSKTSDAFLLTADSFVPDQEPNNEALFGTGNGYWGTRASSPGTWEDGTHYPGTYLAGVYNRVRTDLTQSAGMIAETEHVVNMPDWTALTVTDADGHVLQPSDDEILDYRQELDMRAGISRRIIRRRDNQGRITTISTEQFQSMGDSHLAGLRLRIDTENWDGPLRVISSINGDVYNRNVKDDHNLQNRHLREPLQHYLDEHSVVLEAETKQSDIDVAIASRTHVTAEAGDPIDGTKHDAYRSVGQAFEVEAVQGAEVVVEKLAVASSSRDRALSTPLLDAVERLSQLQDFDAHASPHSRRWQKLWSVFGMELPAGRTDAQALNFNIFHVLQNVALASRDLDAGTPARGLYGEGYRGHIFWDEMLVYPMLTPRQPLLTRALLMYRHRRLPEARARAKREGLRGALFPWQSGSDGREETPSKLYNPLSEEWMDDNSHNQHHVGLALAYSIWNYYEVTGDTAFLTDLGAEMLVEIARLFASNTTYDAHNDRYSISGVMGPDEFHDGYPDSPGEGLRDNAYTNVLASWALTRAAAALKHLDPHSAAALRDQLELDDNELDDWDRISRRLRLVFHDDGVLSQFDGYEDLEEFDWEGYKEKYDDIGRLDLILGAEGDSPNNYKVSKQADALMLFYLFSAEELSALLARMGYHFSNADRERTTNYYVQRTSHGSTMSQLVHAWAFSFSDVDKSWELYQEALLADLQNNKGSSSAEGIHLGVMAGTVDMLMRAYSGLEIRGDNLVLDPNLPEALPYVEFQTHFRGQPVQVHVAQNTVGLHLHSGSTQPLNINVRGVFRKMYPGEEWVAPLPLRE